MNDEKIIISPDTRRKERIPPGQKATEKWPVLHHGSIPDIDISKWKFTISGLVANEIKLDYEEFLSLERIKVYSDIHCVTTWSKMGNLWEGVSSGTIKDMAQVLPGARFVIIHAADGFTSILTLDDFLETDVSFALKHNNETLTLEHGYPVRLVVPRLYFWKSAKWVNGVEFVDKDSPGFWESHGYHNRGDPR